MKKVVDTSNFLLDNVVTANEAGSNKESDMSYEAEFESNVAGIPCIIGVMNYTKVRGSFSRNAASDMDYYGYCESEWEVCDRRGRPAPWLERKLDNTMRDRIEQEVIDYFQGE
jgi:hypothetical protein